MVGINSHFREDGKEEEVGINSHFQYVIDTDDLIESMENRAIKKIFANDGEAYFRNLEKKTALWLESSVDNTIISTGGGFYRQENLKNIGTVIYLKSSFDGILKRIKKAPNAKNKLKKRPLLQNKKEAMKLYDTRVKEYERVADIIVDVENRDLETYSKRDFRTDKMKIIYTKDKEFKTEFENILKRAKSDIKGVSKIVENIIDEIVEDGNEALKRHIEKFDKWIVKSDDELLISQDSMKKAYETLDESLKKSLHIAYERIKAYHEKQLPKSWIDFEENGTILGQKVTAVDRAGLYIPGGKAAYPSSLLMNAIPAKVAGVKEIVVCTPTPNNEVNELLLAACHLCGVSKVYKVGGASAIAAMAYGTKQFLK